jgi:hypothetical protein
LEVQFRRWLIRHAEPRPEVLGQQQDRIFVSVWILLYQIFQGVHEKSLAVNITRICGAMFSLAPRRVGHYGEGEYLSQYKTSKPIFPSWMQIEPLLLQKWPQATPFDQRLRHFFAFKTIGFFPKSRATARDHYQND